MPYNKYTIVDLNKLIDLYLKDTDEENKLKRVHNHESYEDAKVGFFSEQSIPEGSGRGKGKKGKNQRRERRQSQKE